MARPRYTALLMPSLLLHHLCVAHAEATEAARSASEQHAEVEDLVAASFEAVEEQCGGGSSGGAGGEDEREECLMRRTLMAHTDYYYYENRN